MDRNDKIYDLDVSARLQMQCDTAKVKTLGQLLDMPYEKVLRHFSQYSYDEIEQLRIKYANEIEELYGK